MAKARYRHYETEGKAYRHAKAKVLSAVYAINRRRLREFVGLHKWQGLVEAAGGAMIFEKLMAAGEAERAKEASDEKG